MPEIVDRQGEKWHPRLDLGALNEIERRTGCVILARPGTPPDAPGPQELMADLGNLITAVAICCRDECAERGLGVEDLVRRFEAGPLTKIIDAFNEEFAAFTGLDIEELREQAEEAQVERPPLAGPESGGSAPRPGLENPGDSAYGSSESLPSSGTESPGGG